MCLCPVDGLTCNMTRTPISATTSSMANIGSANSLAAGLIVLTSSALLLLPLDSCCLTIGTVYTKKLIYIMLFVCCFCCFLIKDTSLVCDCISRLIHVAFLTHMYHTHPVVAMVIVCICISLAIIFSMIFYIHFCPTFFFVCLEKNI